MHKGKSEAAFTPPFCGMRVRWVDKTKLLTISTHLLALTRWEQGHCLTRLSYRHICVCRAKPEPLAKLSASGCQVGFLFPVQAECRLWVQEQCSVHRASKKLHVAIPPTSHYARELLVTCVFKQVCLPASVWAKRNTYLESQCPSAKSNKHSDPREKPFMQ